MSREFKNIFLLLFLLFVCESCISIQFGNPSLTLFKNQGELGIYGRSASPKKQFRQGESCIRSYFGLFSLGDASAEVAQNQNHMSEVYSIDYSVKTQYFFLQEYCTVVYGK